MRLHRDSGTTVQAACSGFQADGTVTLRLLTRPRSVRRKVRRLKTGCSKFKNRTTKHHFSIADIYYKNNAD